MPKQQLTDARSQRVLSRRGLLGTALAAPLGVAGQESAKAPAGAEEELKTQSAQFRSGYDQMRKVAVPRNVEPATVFRA